MSSVRCATLAVAFLLIVNAVGLAQAPPDAPAPANTPTPATEAPATAPAPANTPPPVTEGPAAAEAPAVAPAQSIESIVREADEILDGSEQFETNEERQAAINRVNDLVAIAQAQYPDSPWVFYLQGRAHALAGRQGDAITQMRKFVDTREGRTEWRAHRMLGDLFVDEFPQLARASYLKAEELIGNEPTVVMGLSRCAQKLGRTEAAIAHARSAAERKPTPAYRAHLARLLLGQGNLAEAQVEADAAVAAAREAVRTNPGQRRPLQELDGAYRLMAEIMQSRFSGGTPTGEQYLELARLMADRAEIAVQLFEFDRLRVLESGVKELSSNAPPQLIEAYALSLARVGRLDAARAEFERLLTIDPENAAAKEWLAGRQEK